MRVILAEPDELTAASASAAAGVEDGDLVRAYSIRDVACCCRERLPGAIVTNLNLADGPSIPFIRALRASGASLSIIAYGVCEVPVDTVVLAFAAGADEVVSDAANRWVEFAVRSRMWLSRSRAQSDDEVGVGEIVIRRASFAVYECGVPLRLTSDQFFIVDCLAARGDAVVPQEELKRNIERHTGRRITDHALREAMRRLRGCFARPERIQTVRNVGYRLLSKSNSC